MARAGLVFVADSEMMELSQRSICSAANAGHRSFGEAASSHLIARLECPTLPQDKGDASAWQGESGFEIG